MTNLLNEIAYCENIKAAIGNDVEIPCSKIVKSQETDFNNFHLPEPWNGDIVNCKILFISSNPSVNHSEEYPLGSWNKEDVADFFTNRFSHEKKWVKNELYPLQKDGNYPKGWVRFWGAVRSIARTLLGTNNPVPGKDYAITEIVHCKSVSEIGVNEAMETCTEKYLDRIIKSSGAKLVISLGDKVAHVIKEKNNIEKNTRIAFINEGKTLVFLPHPNARKERRLDKIFTPKEIELIKSKI